MPLASTPTETPESPHLFVTTRWSLVLAARQQPSRESAAATEELCRAYWYPLYAYARRCGHARHDAEDLTQDFFCRLIQKKWLDSADRAKGKLRVFLIVALKNFMRNEWRRASAQRRGGGKTQVPFDTEFAESRYAIDTSARLPADETFDKEWALTLLDLTVKRLRAEFALADKSGDFESLKSCLMAARGAIDYPALALRLGLNEGAARVAVHRLRKRFREVYREEIMQTLADASELEGELRYLAAALAGD